MCSGKQRNSIMTTAMTTTNGTSEQTAQRLQAAKDQIAKQRSVILDLQRQLQQIQGDRRVLELREQRLRLNVRASEQALTAAQEAASHAQAAALIDGPSDAGDVAA